jgi:hypothetical protein
MRTLVLLSLFAAPAFASAAAHAGPAADKSALAAIQSATGGKMKAAKGRLHDTDCGQDVDYEAQAIDMNGDGQLEVLTRMFGNCYGRAGVQMNLYIRSASGRWQPQFTAFGVPGAPEILKTRSYGFPDIRVVGPGTCFPVNRYDGQQYRLVKRCR